MKDADEFYRSLLDTNKGAFAQGLFKVAYHALSGALYCGLDLRDKEKMEEVERRAEVQLGELNKRFPRKGFGREALEVTLYSSLVRLASSRRSSLRDEVVLAI